MKTTFLKGLYYSAQDENFVLDESNLTIPDKSKFKKVSCTEWSNHIDEMIKFPSYVAVSWTPKYDDFILIQFVDGKVSSFVDFNTNGLANHYITKE